MCHIQSFEDRALILCARHSSRKMRKPTLCLLQAWWKASSNTQKLSSIILTVDLMFSHMITKARVYLDDVSKEFIFLGDYSKWLDYLYDLSSSGLSESQSLWVNSFEDYVDDFVYFVTMVNKESPQHPTFLLSHSMGGLIACMAMSRLPTLINRAALCAPMIRNKCGMKVLDWKYPPPQPLVYWLTYVACYAGV